MGPSVSVKSKREKNQNGLPFLPPLRKRKGEGGKKGERRGKRGKLGPSPEDPCYGYPFSFRGEKEKERKLSTLLLTHGSVSFIFSKKRRKERGRRSLRACICLQNLPFSGGRGEKKKESKQKGIRQRLRHDCSVKGGGGGKGERSGGTAPRMYPAIYRL